MDAVGLYRGAGWAAIASGVLLVVGWGLSYARGDLRSPSLLALWIALAAFILMQVGLAGIYLRMHETSGWLGLAGFSLAFVGTAVFIGYTVGGEASPAIPEPSLGPLGGLAWALGMVALAVAAWRAGSVPAAGALLWIAGTVVYEGGVATYSVGAVIGAVIFAVGFGWAGWALMGGG